MLLYQVQLVQLSWLLTDVQTAVGTLERGRNVYDVVSTLMLVVTITRIQQGIAVNSTGVTR